MVQRPIIDVVLKFGEEGINPDESEDKLGKRERKETRYNVYNLSTAEDEFKNLILNVSSAIESSVEIAGVFQPTTRARIEDIRNAVIKIRLNNEKNTCIFVGGIRRERNYLETAGRGVFAYKIAYKHRSCLPLLCDKAGIQIYHLNGIT
ncbi:hypothetical protein AVEN_6172-1 [Araneus ventricosus]|uniref:Uncharacterized protein n=1 Tax=Araneus ventricosus TaxID=182803 RepID=A0A4Y2S9J9_ARAVE|nr:hypothetical protein AVEN_6172-1 [Araneus ventricosus]